MYALTGLKNIFILVKSVKQKVISIVLVYLQEGYVILENRFIFRGGQGEIVEKKSRFIGQVFAIKDEDEAIAIIESVKKQYWDARHNCFAYVLGSNNEIQRYSDDGEPGGTAGKPMLEILVNERLINVLVVVTRYFGGTLLGTGGLVRAYQQAVKAGLSQCETGDIKKGTYITVVTDYNGIGKIQYIVGNESENVHIEDTEYTDSVKMTIISEKTYVEGFIKKVTQATNGKAGITVGDDVTYSVISGRMVIL